MPASDTAYLEIILGPMFSGKTSRLVEIYKKCKFCNIPVMVINRVIDDRYDYEGTSNQTLSTHDKIGIPCTKIDKLMSIKFQILNYDIILINEGQFFPDLVEFVEHALECGKKIYVCGLDGDFKRNKFGQILDLIPLCDSVVKLTSLCGSCLDGKPAIFTLRTSSEKEQTVVGCDNYMPVCRMCYNSETETETETETKSLGLFC